MPPLLELPQAPVHNSTVAATEAAEHFEALVPAAEAVVVGSKVGIGVLVVTVPGRLPVNRTMQVRAAERHKPQMLARHPHTTARPQHTRQRILSDRLRSYK